jgi:hypothetical protein
MTVGQNHKTKMKLLNRLRDAGLFIRSYPDLPLGLGCGTKVFESMVSSDAPVDVAVMD